ncbi:MAG: glycoside hydrolase family 125 protein [Phycisphaerae bacterium]|nr:glycoside hydrolase family 125 protein [Phycisphaerae bacterium]
MFNRREFIKTSSALTLGLGMTKSLYAQNPSNKFVSQRPPVNKRTFVSEGVENKIKEVKSFMKDPELAWMFENCYPNTLDTTVDYELIDGKPDTVIITGDIDAMWLRDSTAQVWPYMPLLNEDTKLKKLVKGLVNRQVKCVNLDPYANSFYKDKTKESHWASDRPAPIDGVHERKWEIDSLCYVVRLADKYYQSTGDKTIFDADFDRAMRTIVKVFRQEQRKGGNHDTPYRFARSTDRMTDAPVHNGVGRPIKPVGLICSSFRPSDDATNLSFLIPSNLFAVQSMKQMAEFYSKVYKDQAFARECEVFAKEVAVAIDKYAVNDHLTYGKIYAYETDGFGNHLFMDDANVPSLLSLSYLGVHKPTDDIYKRTRKYLLSADNPWYLKGTHAEGAGSPHTGPNTIWPMGIILRALTSTDANEIKLCLHMLKRTHAGTGFMHESFNKDNPNDFSRSWFAWANTLFGELIVNVYNDHPELLKINNI